ncbi:MAG: hypothetical protein CL607_05465 [Anaerolineaceae bacterium]|nr:hypothetical protein [Anaerolineaceae bacterium]
MRLTGNNGDTAADAIGVVQPKRNRQALIVLPLMLLVVLLGGYFRFNGLNWDDFSAMHPDERFLTMNSLPLIGGRLELTPDSNVPPQSVIATFANASYYDGASLSFDTTSRIGVVEDTFAVDAVRWTYGLDRMMTYSDASTAARALADGEIAALVMDQTAASVFLITDDATGAVFLNIEGTPQVQIIDTLSSEEIQQAHCLERYPETGGIGGYFDTQCSPYNPHNASTGYYAYGTLPVLMAHTVSAFVQQQDIAGSDIFDFEGGTLIWRFLSAFFDVGSIIVIYFIGARTHNRWVGLFSALLYAAAPLAIEKAHFGTVNSITAFFVILAIWAAVGVQQRGKLFYYAAFGIALGAAVAGRINTAPLAGVVVLAAMVQMVPFLDRSLDWDERQRVASQATFGLILAAVLSLVTFRIANPYAFTGPGLLGLGINPRWLADLGSSQFNVSGNMDAAPNWQWVGRPPYLYPLKDMILWGMGIGMGIMAWIGWAWSGYRLLKGRTGSLANLLPFVWVTVYFAWIGRLWVMTMRYYLPLYAPLALLGGWAIYAVWRASRERDLPLVRGITLFFGVFLALIPAYYLVTATALTTTAIAAAVVAILLIILALIPGAPRVRAFGLGTFVLAFTLLWGLMHNNIYNHQLTRVQGSVWVWENIPGDFSMQVDGAPEGTPLINIVLPNSRPESSITPGDMLSAASQLIREIPSFVEFVAPASGTISSVYSPHIGDPFNSPEDEVLQISVASTDDLNQLAIVTVTQDFPRDNHILGDAYTFQFDPPFQVEEGKRYTFKVEALAGNILTSGAVIATEAPWDDRLTTIKACEYPQGITLADDPPPGLVGYDECNGRQSWYGLVQSYDIDLSYPIDETYKRDMMLNALEVSEYIGITSNRFYDTLSRNPIRWPMSNRYYDALFSGELGFDLVEVRHEQYEFGPLSVSDQYLPIYDSPQWLNELEPDEAFHVYDHPTVFIFKKRDDYDQARVAQILNDVSIVRVEGAYAQPGELGSAVGNVAYWSSLEADEASTALMQRPEFREINEQGGTWSQRFDSDSIFNSNQIVGVIGWWLLLFVIGLVTWPLLYTAFPTLADRGYAFAKIVGLLILAWAAWMLGSVGVLAWSQGGLFLLLLILTLTSAWFAWRQRASMIAFIKAHWSRILWIEVLTIILFVIFIGVRLTNPDLWHFSKGGEKPMDFGYFNAVLRSTVFPAYDPWYAGGYINYYYFGFVVVGSPVLMLKLVPAFAYNLIVPTLFALTGIGAFSVAFNIVAAMRDRRRTAEDGDPNAPAPTRRASSWLAGIVALLLCVAVGNLDTIRVLGNGIASMGGYQQYDSIESYYRDQYLDQYGVRQDTSGTLVLPIEYETELANRLSSNSIVDRLSYEVTQGVNLLTGFSTGISKLAEGQPLLIGSDRWYWGPSRVLNEFPVSSGNAITEMPYFTFLYGDLHAHMINMPVMLFALLFVFNEVFLAGSRARRNLDRALAIGLGALAIGLMTAINTWDWPSFMVFATVGLGYAWWLRWRTISRHSLVDMLLSIGGFLFVARFVAIAHTSWYAAIYQSAELYLGRKTPLWAYFDIHGLFLLLIVSLLIWETGRWFRSVHVKALRGKGFWLSAGALGAGVLTAVGLILAMMGYQVAIIVIPLVIWIVALFFRPGQSRVMQYVLVLAGFALALTLAVEIITITGDIGRQNTVFKFYLQVWLIFSVVGGAAFSWLFTSSDYWRAGLRFLWYIPLMTLFVIAAMFPITATRARTLDRYSPSSGFYHSVLPEETIEDLAELYFVTPEWLREANNMPDDAQPAMGDTITIIPPSDLNEPATTLDGIAYMQYAAHHPLNSEAAVLINMDHDYNIIRWLQENVVGTPVIIEGRNPASEYTWTGRIAINTGLPSVLGWNFHQRQQRTFDPLPTMVQLREGNINYFYDTADIAGAVRILRTYDVRYIILSTYERIWSTSAGLAKFDIMVDMGLLNKIEVDSNAFIYEVNEQALADFALAQNAFFDVLRLDDAIFNPGLDDLTFAQTIDSTLSALGKTESDVLAEATATLDRFNAQYIAVPSALIEQTEPQIAYFIQQLAEQGVLVQLDENAGTVRYQVDTSALG